VHCGAVPLVCNDEKTKQQVVVGLRQMCVVGTPACSMDPLCVVSRLVGFESELARREPSDDDKHNVADDDRPARLRPCASLQIEPHEVSYSLKGKAHDIYLRSEEYQSRISTCRPAQ
jgi:hypothetical protein